MEIPKDIINVVKPVKEKKIREKKICLHVSLEPDYFRKYYHENLAIQINCDRCNKLISKQKLKRHYLTKKCIEIHNLN
jgi:uncharacterized protein YutE (UPF0331/DUF86 family)